MSESRLISTARNTWRRLPVPLRERVWLVRQAVAARLQGTGAVARAGDIEAIAHGASQTAAQTAPTSFSQQSNEHDDNEQLSDPASSRLDAGHGLARRAANRTRVTLVISPNEISFAHGTGVLLTRLIDDRDNVILMRSQTSYGGSQNPNALASFVLAAPDLSREEIFESVTVWLRPYEVEAVLCVPFFETDLTLAIAAANVAGAPLGLWLMDDNCLISGNIPAALMEEAIGRATSLFSISAELRKAYETRFRKKMWVLPPLVAPHLLRYSASTPSSTALASKRGVVIGNIWSQKWLDALRGVTRESGLELDWYCSNSELSWLDVPTDKLARDGINVITDVTTDELIDAITAAAYVVVPSDPGNCGNTEKALGDMSLPTRVPFVVAAAGTPLLVLGRPDTAVAGFVKQLEVGRCAPYEADQVLATVVDLVDDDRQREIRTRCAEYANDFSFDGAWDFAFHAIRHDGECRDDRFERMFALRPGEFAYYCDDPIPRHVFLDFRECYALCQRLSRAGWNPDFVLDVGASNGIWSYYMSEVFSDSRFVLCEPLVQNYGETFSRDNFTLVEAAIADHEGTATFQVSGDLFGSSLIALGDVASEEESVEVQTLTVDEVVRRESLSGRGLMKVDVQFAEHLVIAGATQTLGSAIDVVILELTLQRINEQAKTLVEMVRMMEDLGFRVYDHVGGWRIPQTGELEQMDMVFVRNDFQAT